jgi:hypothetical protein
MGDLTCHPGAKTTCRETQAPRRGGPFMGSCWHVDPSERPVAEGICHYLDHNVKGLSRALEVGHPSHSDRPYGPTTPPSSETSAPVRPTPSLPPSRSQPPQVSVISAGSPQPPQYGFLPLSLETSDVTRYDSVKARAPKEMVPFYRQIYRFLADSCLQLRSKVLSLDYRSFFRHLVSLN